jgi:hypothetical protein
MLGKTIVGGAQISATGSFPWHATPENRAKTGQQVIA